MSRSHLPLPNFELEPSAEFAPPGKIVAGLYQVGSVIGVGTYGEVRHAISLTTGERVALKIVDLGRFSVETAGLMRKEISILKMLSHQNCIRIIEVHENVPFGGHWCEACACTSFKRSDKSTRQANSQTGKFIGLTSTSVCAVCSHSAAEHSGVSYHPILDDHHHTSLTYATPTHSHTSLHHEDEDEGETRQVMLIVQELAAGGELFSMLSHSGPLPEDIARFYFGQLIDGLEHLHSRSITHRDLKPENLVFSEDFQLKIADFGLASLGTKVPNSDPTNLTSNQSQDDIRHYSGVGSQPYSAPEVYYVRELYQGRGYKGPPCDVWSAAVILFVMLVGRPPFVRPLAKTYGAHLRRCRHFVAIMNGQGLDMLHPHAKDLLQKMLKIVPSERLTLDQVRKHPWMNGPVPSHEELCKQMEERSMHMWNSSNTEMTHVLSTMRSKDVSAANTPLISAINNLNSPSASPTLSALNSPSFSASSIPPSPYIQSHSHRASPASFLHQQPQFLSQSQSQPHSHQTTTTTTRHATIHPPVGVISPTPLVSHGITIASSINPTTSQAIAAMVRMTINSDHESEIPNETVVTPQRPPSHIEDNTSSPHHRAPARPVRRVSAESKQQMQQQHANEKPKAVRRFDGSSRGSSKHLQASEAHEHFALPQTKRIRRQSDTSPPTSRSSDVSHDDLSSASTAASTTSSTPLHLASSLSFPPSRQTTCSFHSSLETHTLIDSIQQRLSKDASVSWTIRPAGSLTNDTVAPNMLDTASLTGSPTTSITPQQQQQSTTDLGTEECIIEVRAVYRRKPIEFTLSIRSLSKWSTGKKGRLVIATQVHAGDTRAFRSCFEHMFRRFNEE